MTYRRRRDACYKRRWRPLTPKQRAAEKRHERKHALAQAICAEGAKIAFLFWGSPQRKRPPKRALLEPHIATLYKLHRRYVRIRR